MSFIVKFIQLYSSAETVKKATVGKIDCLLHIEHVGGGGSMPATVSKLSCIAIIWI